MWRLYSHTVKKALSLSDHNRHAYRVYSAKNYPEKVRRIRYYEQRNQKHLTFLTNNSRCNTQNRPVIQMQIGR